MIEHQVVKSLKTGNECLKKLHELMSLDEIETIMDDTREAVEHQRVYFIDSFLKLLFYFKIILKKKIDELISGEFSREDMDEINSELESIIKSSLPEIPQNEIVIPKEKEPAKEKKGEHLILILFSGY